MSELFKKPDYEVIYKKELIDVLTKGMSREGDSGPETQAEILDIIEWINITGVGDRVVRNCIFEKIEQVVKNPVTMEFCKRIREGLDSLK